MYNGGFIEICQLSHIICFVEFCWIDFVYISLIDVSLLQWSIFIREG